MNSGAAHFGRYTSIAQLSLIEAGVDKVVGRYGMILTHLVAGSCLSYSLQRQGILTAHGFDTKRKLKSLNRDLIKNACKVAPMVNGKYSC